VAWKRNDLTAQTGGGEEKQPLQREAARSKGIAEARIAELRHGVYEEISRQSRDR